MRVNVARMCLIIYCVDPSCNSSNKSRIRWFAVHMYSMKATFSYQLLNCISDMKPHCDFL